ncbi:MAG: tetratricopeptide repeat protein [Cyanobacteriota bacterium]|jgi:tetratricopeptide (TPR) repeat protein
MQKFFQRLWRWLQSLLGLADSRSPQLRAAPEALSDLDYEFLYRQLLEGVAHGWHEGRVLKFFEQLGERGKTRPWVDWLERFQTKVLASAPDLILAARMMRLGELAQSFPRLEPIGSLSHGIARQLYGQQSQRTEAQVWEYSGPDEGLSALPEETQLETYTLEELEARLGSDPILAQQVALDLGLTVTDPQTIIQALLEKFPEAREPENAGSAADWLALGLEQANQGQLEAALASWERALALDPQSAPAWHNRGSALGNLGRLEEALVCFEEATRLNPKDALGWFHQGAILEILEAPLSAIARYQVALDLDPQLQEVQDRIAHLEAQVAGDYSSDSNA